MSYKAILGIKSEKQVSTIQRIIVRKGREDIFNLDKEVFELLFDSTVVRRNRKFYDALKTGYIEFDHFIKLTRDGEVPYPLFFINKPFAEEIIEDFNKKVYCGVSKEQLSISSRGDITLADISLIIKDITRKQNFLKQFITKQNIIVGLYAKTDKSIIDQAQEIRNLIDYNIDKVYYNSKEKSFNIFVDGLAKHNIFISLYVHDFSPQRIDKKLQFSGIAIKDKSCPYLFIKAGDNDNAIELWGRRLFTAALLLSCLLHADCRPVTMDGSCQDLVSNEHYLFAEELLMPKDIFIQENCSTFDDVEKLAERYSVSPSAIIMRLFRLNMIDKFTKNEYFDILKIKWRELKNGIKYGNKIGAKKAIIRYNNKIVVRHIIERYKSGNIDEHMVKKLLCYKKGEKLISWSSKMFSIYLIDANAIRALKPEEILEKKNADRAIITIDDVRYEVQRFQKRLKVLDSKPLNSIAFYKMSEIINEHRCVRAVVDYINNKGAADVGLLAYSLTFNDGKLLNDDVYIVTNDADLQTACKELNCKWISINDFKDI